MTEVTTVPENDFSHLTVPELIDLKYELTQEKRAVSAKEKQLGKDITTIDRILWQYHEENPEVSKAAGAKAEISWSEENHYSPNEGCKEQVRDWLFENGHQHLMTWHLNRAATEEYNITFGEIPNTQVYVKQKISCRKL